MPSAPAPENESGRVAALHSLGVLDTPREQAYDDLVDAVRDSLNVPIVLLCLVDSDRQWFKAAIGVDCSETDREMSFCAWAILQDQITVVEDALHDDRFRDNPLVSGAPQVRFYMGAPLITQQGYRIGTLCALDFKPQKPDQNDLMALKLLASHVMTLLELESFSKTIMNRFSKTAISETRILLRARQYTEA